MGVLWVLLAAVLWGTLGAAAKPALDAGASGFLLALGRASLIGAAYIVYRRGVPLSWGMLALALLGVAPMYVSYMYSVEYNGVGTAAVLLYTAPLWTVLLLAPLVLGEKPSLAKTLFGLVSVAGVYTLYGAGSASIKGILVGLASGASYSVVIVMSRKLLLSGYRLLDVALAPIALATPVILVSALGNGEVETGNLSKTVLSSMYLSIVTGVAYIAYVKGLEHTEASKASIIATVEPLTAIILDLTLYHSAYTQSQVVGSLLILASVLGIILYGNSNRGDSNRLVEGCGGPAGT